ncbi:MAG: hypothetical protein EPN22_13500 [Nitrospirae bacterium]|nr:MAG: hypothetical protein EPN22_13500 [Nitrospirota bacterium]
MNIIIISGSRSWMLDISTQLIAMMPGKVVGLITEDLGSFRNVLKHFIRRRKRYGLIKTLDQIFLQLFLMVRGDKTPRKHNSELPFEMKNISRMQTSDINSTSVREFIIFKKGDIIVNIGGGLLRDKTYGAARICSLNIHSGITPRYRGTNPNVWAIYEGNLSCVGVTVHKIDAGIDTGEVLFQKKIDVFKGQDTLESITVQAFEEGIKGIQTVLNYYEMHGSFPVADVGSMDDRIYGWYGLSHYMRAEKILNNFLV